MKCNPRYNFERKFVILHAMLGMTIGSSAYVSGFIFTGTNLFLVNNNIY